MKPFEQNRIPSLIEVLERYLFRHRAEELHADAFSEIRSSPSCGQSGVTTESWIGLTIENE